MRDYSDIKHLSASSLGLWNKDRDEWVKRYIGGIHQRQTVAMGVGSYFDELIKNKLCGESDKWANQVDAVCEDAALAKRLGALCYSCYESVGALGRLYLEMGSSERICESQLLVEIGGVPIMGKPDLMFNCSDDNDCGCGVILDWKCNGICGSGRSPSKGYVGASLAPEARGTTVGRKHIHGHKDAILGMVGRCMINMNATGMTEEWTLQLGTYMLQMAMSDGGVGRVDQILRGRSGEIGVYHFGYGISESVLDDLLHQYQGMWESIKAGHVYTDLDLEDSRKRVLMIAATCGDTAFNAICDR